jgi:hypothetical protein
MQMLQWQRSCGWAAARGPVQLGLLCAPGSPAGAAAAAGAAAGAAPTLGVDECIHRAAQPHALLEACALPRQPLGARAAGVCGGVVLLRAHGKSIGRWGVGAHAQHVQAGSQAAWQGSRLAII